ncbi:ROK family glucokinase [Nocardioides sp. AE5]|uniref:ROK family glucokinase n=1 Tax=Nocardioides sp. AE5 TaxID=2962573 RepID=UPI002880F511|nr:ROK family glucokinase [Nocardioides sp. AE5]MDT0201210.1 ROK family glucokinase [Nocardioides sp. AE5]
MGATIGIDVGGTKIAGAVVDDRGTIGERLQVPSPATDSDALVDAISDMVATLQRGGRADAVGISAAGFVAADRSTILFAPNLAWRNLPLGAEIARRTGLTAVVENDGNAAAWGEYVHGAGAGTGCRDLLLVAIGTGVGGGIVMDGALQRGGFGIAGEIGHVRLVRDGLPCGCGRRGCLEQYGSGTALVRSARAAAAAHPEAAAALVTAAGGRVEEIDGPVITDQARQGDPFAVDLLAGLGTWLGEGLAQLASVLDPQLIVVGGGASDAGNLLLAPMRTTYAEHLGGGSSRPVAPIVVATLGNQAGIVGVAHLAARAAGADA